MVRQETKIWWLTLMVSRDAMDLYRRKDTTNDTVDVTLVNSECHSAYVRHHESESGMSEIPKPRIRIPSFVWHKKQPSSRRRPTTAYNPPTLQLPTPLLHRLSIASSSWRNLLVVVIFIVAYSSVTTAMTLRISFAVVYRLMIVFAFDIPIVVRLASRSVVVVS